MNDGHAGRASEPLFYAERIAVRIVGSRLLRGDVSLQQRIDAPKIVIAQESRSDGSRQSATAKANKLFGLVSRVLARDVDRVEIHDGELLFVDLTRPRHPRLWLHGLALTASGLAGGSPGAERAVVAGRARISRSGAVEIAGTFAPQARRPTFDLRVSVSGLKMAELYDFTEGTTGLHASKGTLDCTIVLAARDGALTGQIKPVMRDVELEAGDTGVVSGAKAWIANRTLDTLSRDGPRGKELTRLISVRGDLDVPAGRVLPTLLALIQEAFLRDLREAR